VNQLIARFELHEEPEQRVCQTKINVRNVQNAQIMSVSYVTAWFRTDCDDEHVIAIDTCRNVDFRPWGMRHAWPLTTLLLKPSSSQRSNDGIKSLTGIVWFELYLQATLSAIQEYA